MENPPPESWLCSAHCCGRRDLAFWTVREETLRQEILQEQEEVFRFFSEWNKLCFYQIFKQDG